MSKLGIHFPNAGFHDLDVLWSIPWENFVILHLNRDWVPEIRLRFPKATILVRAFLKNWTTTNPVRWASEISQCANELHPFNVHLTFANEQNLAAEGHPLGARPGMDYPPASVYRDILEWDTAVIQELRRQIPWAVIHFPALSQGHSDDQADAGYVGFEIVREAVNMCDVLDAHIYWDERERGQRKDKHYGERYRMLHSLFPDKPIFISECGSQWSKAEEHYPGVTPWLEALPDYVTGACWFIWDSDVMNQHWILRDKPPMVEGMRSYQLAAAALSDSVSIVNPINISMRLVMGWPPFNATAFARSDTEQVIGYRHVIRAGDVVGNSIPESAAKDILRHDLELSLSALAQITKVPLTANQKAALLSLVYEVGIEELRDSVLLGRLNATDYVGAALELSEWRSSAGSISLEIARRRQIESELFLRDVVTPVSATIAFPMPPAPAAPLLCSISATATWVSVRQGQRYQVIGVWYYEDASPTFTSVKDGADKKDGSEKLESGGRIFVKVEDESGVGISAELIVRRWDNPGGQCEPHLSDASGVVWFELAADSRFDPRQAQGPDRIQVGDCIVGGLGIPSYGTVVKGQTVHAVRIRKIA